MKKLIFLLVLINSFSLFILASEPAIWSVNSRADVLRGDSRGVSIGDNGAISLAPRISEIFKTEQSYVWSSAVDASGNVFLGTGADGKIYKVDASGNGKLFYDTNELNVAALAAGNQGEIYAGTSPDGKIYRIDANGNATVYFEPKEKYIWSLAVLADGSLAIGTGENGKIYKVKSANASAESSLLFDTSETHIITLAADKSGNLYAGTDSNGLVLRFAADGKPFALLDSPLREIHEIAVGTDGSVYALALGDSSAAPAAPNPSATPERATVSVERPNPAQPEPPQKSRYDLTNAKSAVYRILPDGGNDIIWNSPTVTPFSIAANPNGNGVLLGTSEKGRIYSVTNDSQETLLVQSDEGQISTLLSRGNQVLASSSNQGKLYRIAAETAAEGSFESSVLNAKASADWGRIWWLANGSVTLQTRSGNTEKPDETWSAWSAAYADQKGAQINSPKAKFLQWRAILRGTSVLKEVNVSYLPRNIAPEILSIQILPTGVGLLSNPPLQTDPNIENSGLDPTAFGLPPVMNIPPRRVYQRGARSLLWTAEDRNGDRLVYDVFYRAAQENDFKLLRGDLRDNFFTVDGSALADGRYVFKIAAKDAPSNPFSQVLTGERTSEPIDIDNGAPTVSVVGAPTVSGDQARVVFDASDAASFLQKAEYSVNGGDWQNVYSDDRISDASRERYTLEIPLKTAGEYTISLRVFDVNGNVGNARVSVRK